MNNLLEIAKTYQPYTVEIRRELHRNPEPSLAEFETSNRIQQELNAMGIPYEIIGETGIVATLKGAASGKTIALRADTDALELNDEIDTPYRSQKPGLCHACGHDGHTAMLLTAAKILKEKQNELQGTVLFVFQPAEESISGAKKMLEEKNFLQGVDSILGIHLMSDLPTGNIAYSEGAAMSSADSFRIQVQGKGGHGSAPHQTIDSTVTACAIVLNAQAIVSREINPFDFGVLTVGIVAAGSRNNIIADSAIIEGTIRTYKPEVRAAMKDSLVRVAKTTAETYRAMAEVSFPTQTGAVINDPEQCALAVASAKKIVGVDHVQKIPPSTGSEDFSYFLEKVPGAYLIVGCRNEEKGIIHPHHHPLFDIDEDALPIGTALYVEYVLDHLTK